MRPFRDLPIGRKLVAVAVAVSVLALVVSGAIFLFSSFLSIRETVRDDLVTQANIVADNAASAVAFQDRRTADETVMSLRTMRAVDVACIYDSRSAVFSSYVSPTTRHVCPDRPPEDGEYALESGIAIVKQISYLGTRDGTLYLHGNFSQVWDRLRTQSYAALAALVVGGIAALVLSLRIHRVVSRPILELSSTAAAISRAGDYSLRASKHADDEIGQLVDAFNGMLAEVERRDEQVRSASRLKDDFLAALSHELRTPLNAMLGWIQVLRLGQLGPDATARAYESIERNARAQATLIEDLLDISRVVTGKLHLRAEPVDLTTVIEAALEVVRPAAEAKQITVRRNLGPAPQMVIGDVDRLQQIAWNLLSNAMKFTGQGGHVDVSLAVEDGMCEFKVTDDGVGITADFLPHVFDRFRQADGSLTRRHGGLGLGLAIVRELTELHGGRVYAESDGAGKGTTMTVILPSPSSSALQRAPRTDRQLVTRLDGISVLVVDDDEDARQLAVMAITRAGGTAEGVSSASAAMQMLEDSPFDVILSDLAMPGVDGFEMLQTVRKKNAAAGPAVTTPAVAITAHAGIDTEARARAAGFQAVVTKPYDIETLLTAIRSAAAGLM